MIRLGERQPLKVVKRVDFGVYLSPEGGEQEERVLLPARQVEGEVRPGDTLEVFVYRDSDDRKIATTRTPLLVMGQVAELRVAAVGKIGALLDWGLEKDLFLPYRQQVCRVQEGDRVLVGLYLDKSSRLCATMNVYPYLRSDSPYRKGDQVRGRVYTVSEAFGAFVAVDNLYSALIPKKEFYGEAEPGGDVTAWVTEVKADGRLSLSIRDKAYRMIGADAEKILGLIDSYDGVLPFNDRVSPEIIRRETGMSKNEFKRAVGSLLKAGRVEIAGKVIRRV